MTDDPSNINTNAHKLNFTWPKKQLDNSSSESGSNHVIYMKHTWNEQWASHDQRSNFVIYINNTWRKQSQNVSQFINNICLHMTWPPTLNYIQNTIKFPKSWNEMHIPTTHQMNNEHHMIKDIPLQYISKQLHSKQGKSNSICQLINNICLFITSHH